MCKIDLQDLSTRIVSTKNDFSELDEIPNNITQTYLAFPCIFTNISTWKKGIQGPTFGKNLENPQMLNILLEFMPKPELAILNL